MTLIKLLGVDMEYLGALYSNSWDNNKLDLARYRTFVSKVKSFKSRGYDVSHFEKIIEENGVVEGRVVAR